MKDYKLVRVLKSLTQNDLQNLKRFANSPYFQVREEISDFLFLVIKSLEKNETSFEKIWSESIEAPFNEERLRKKLHESLLVVEKFLAAEDFFNSSVKTARGTLRAVVEKDVDDLIPKSLKSLEQELNDIKQLNFEYYGNRFELYTTIYNLAGFDRKIAIKKNRINSEFLQKADKVLNEIFLSEKLRLAHLLNSDNSVSNRDDKLTFIDEVLGIAKRTARKGSKPAFYVQLYELHKSEDILSDVRNLHEYVSVKSELFEPNELRNILFTLLNYAIRLANQGVKEASNVIFELYKVGLNNDTFLLKSELLPDTFRNITLYACRVKEYDWTLSFIEKYQFKLNRKYRETAVAFNRARVYINLKNYEQVIEQLRDVEFDDISYNLNTKLMLLVSYFELDEFDALDSLIKSFNVFLRRKTTISESRKSSFKNFNATLQDIVRIKERRDKVKLKTIRQKLESKMIAPNKSWLLDKVEELEKHFGIVRKLNQPIESIGTH